MTCAVRQRAESDSSAGRYSEGVCNAIPEPKGRRLIYMTNQAEEPSNRITEEPMNALYRCSDTDFSASSPRIGSLYISSCAVLIIMNTHAPNTATFISTGMILCGPHSCGKLSSGLNTQSTISHATT